MRKLATDEKLTDEEIKEYSKLLGRKLTRIEAFILKQLLDLLNIIEEQIKEVENEIMKFLPEEAVVTKIPGIGPISAATIYAELGDVSRFESSKQAASYAGVSGLSRAGRPNFTTVSSRGISTYPAFYSLLQGPLRTRPNLMASIKPC
nr:transposase [Acidianus brierleyi]